MLIAITTSEKENGIPKLTKESIEKIESLERGEEQKTETPEPTSLSNGTANLEPTSASDGTANLDPTSASDGKAKTETSSARRRKSNLEPLSLSDGTAILEAEPTEKATAKKEKSQTTDGAKKKPRVAKSKKEIPPKEENASLNELELQMAYWKSKSEKETNEDFQAVGEITQSLVANQLYRVYLRCMQEIPVTVKDKETGKQVPTGIYQFDVRSALKALELLGDAVGLFKPTQTDDAKPQTYEEFLKNENYDYEF